MAIARLGECRYPSPLPLTNERGDLIGGFVSDPHWVLSNPEEAPRDSTENDRIWFEKAGPRERLYFDPKTVRAAIVTCGGLCPGLNSVIRSLYIALNLNYGVPEVLGLRYGYAGLNPALGLEPERLTLSRVSQIHKDGGTILGSSRGPQPIGVMVQFLIDRKIDILFCIGGDGTLTGALELSREVRRRGLPIAVVGLPKTIDNDIGYSDRSFGLFTAVEQSVEVIHRAHTEAKGTQRGIGLVKVMGRHSGFIAALASLASQEANFVLVPEVPFRLDGPKGFLASLSQRMRARGHAVIVVAEGAGQEMFEDEPAERDASGNLKLRDIGTRLKSEITGYFKAQGEPVDLKYIDPSYIIRSGPANSVDNLLCIELSRYAVHAAMSGRTELVVNQLNGRFVHVPIGMAVEKKQKIDPEGQLWMSVLMATGQPVSFCG
jgi:6-phosphofructokinase 1